MVKDRYLGVLLLAIAVWVAWMTSRISYTPMTDDPGPGLFPYFGCALLAICGAGLLAWPQRSSPEDGNGRDFWIRIARGFVPPVLYAILLWCAGFHIATLLMLFVFYWQMSRPGKFGLLAAVIYTLVTYGLIYAFFHYGLGSYLPEGFLF